MAKYTKLEKFFSKSPASASEFILSFSQIELIMSANLPASAATLPAWWANDRTHTQALAWMNAEFKTYRPNPEEGWICFQRVRD